MESALATHMVRARTELGRWQAGVRQIQKASDSRDATALAAALDQWGFAGDVPEVIEAQMKLEQWHQVQLEIEPVLQAALARRDLPALRVAMRELNANGPRDVKGANEANALLEKYSSRTKRLRMALSTKSAPMVESSLKTWEFAKEDPLYLAGQQMLARRQRHIQVLRELAAEEPHRGPQISKAVTTWEFETGQQDYMKACEVQRRYLQEDAMLQKLAQNAPMGLGRVQVSLAAWPFATDAPDGAEGDDENKGGPGWARARAVLAAYRSAVQDALDARDALVLRHHWEIPGSGAAALFTSSGPPEDEEGNYKGVELAEAVDELLAKHQESQREVREALDSAPRLEAEQRPVIERLVVLWDFSMDDSAIAEAKEWLQRNGEAAAHSKGALQDALASGDAQAVEKAVMEARGLPETDLDMVAAQNLCKEARNISVKVQWASGGETILEEQIDRESSVTYLKERLAILSECPVAAQCLKFPDRANKELGTGTLASEGVKAGALLLLSRIEEKKPKERSNSLPPGAGAQKADEEGLSSPPLVAEVERGSSAPAAPGARAGEAADALAGEGADAVAEAGLGGKHVGSAENVDGPDSRLRGATVRFDDAGAVAVGGGGDDDDAFMSTADFAQGPAAPQPSAERLPSDGEYNEAFMSTADFEQAPKIGLVGVAGKPADEGDVEAYDAFESTMQSGAHAQGTPMGGEAYDDFEQSVDAASPKTPASKYNDEFEKSQEF